MIFVTTRCDQEKLYLSPETNAQVEEVSNVPITPGKLRKLTNLQFFDTLLPNTSTAFLNGKYVTMFLLSGGSVFQSDDSCQKFSLIFNR
jgi:hypothetical protein